ncbi:MAG: methyltransferase type 12, partial [Myxococcales bacterium]
MDLASRIPALLARARALLGLPGGPPDRLAATEIGRAATAVEALHEGLVGRRDLANVATYGERAHLGAYLLWWWPQTYAKVKSVLRLVPDLPRGPRILDVGAGPAPAALALL